MRPFELLKLFALRTTRYTLHPTPYTLFFLAFLTFFAFTLALTSQTYAQHMADYCYLPPFVMDPNTPPNVMLVYEKSQDIIKRAYKDTYTYDAFNLYTGFFNANAKYQYNTTGKYFEQISEATCTANLTSGNKYNCFSGNVLNWALMSSLDITRTVFMGFSWPKAINSREAGDVFTYKGCFLAGGTASTCEACTNSSTCSSCNANCQTAVTYGDGGTANVYVDNGANIDKATIGGQTYTYAFCMTNGTPTVLNVRVKQGSGLTNLCSGSCKESGGCYQPVPSTGGVGQVAMKFSKVCSTTTTTVCSANSDCPSGETCSDESRVGIVQEYADRNSDYIFDSDAPRWGARRWQTSTSSEDRNRDVQCDDTSSGACTSTGKTTLLRGLLSALSKTPCEDSQGGGTQPYLDDMMDDIIKYFKDGTAKNDVKYRDFDDVYTQTPYKWGFDLATPCRKTFAIFVTIGRYLNGSSAARSATCTSGSNSTDFSQDTCYAYKTDLYPADGDTSNTSRVKQNIRTYVVHTNYYGSKSCTTTADCTDGGICSNGICDTTSQLQYAASSGGGEYIKVTSGSKLQSALEEALLNILSTSASASTVATLTTQTRESSTLTQAYFYPKREGTNLKWVGYLRLLWSDTGANLREDTANNAWLDLKKDKILSFYYDSTEVAYKAKTYDVNTTSPPDSYLKIDNCSTYTSKSNDNVSAIWNAQSRLLDRTPEENPANSGDKRNIYVGIGDTSTADGRAGRVSSSTCSGSAPYSGFCDFKTSLASTLQPFWSYANFCSTLTGRRCDNNSDCNFCPKNTSWVCSSNPDCYFCSTVNTSTKCPNGAGGSDCNYCQNTYYKADHPDNLVIKSRTGCNPANVTANGAVIECRYCTNDTSIVCTSDADCPVGGLCWDNDYKDCVTSAGLFSDCPGSPEMGGACTYSGDSCNATDTCNTSGTCNVDCDTNNCTTSVIKYIRGYDSPTPAGGSFRVRHSCPAGSTPDAVNCPAGHTCSNSECKKNCSSDSDCFSGDKCTNNLCSSGSDLTKTLKLGDIVYSTPRISPNSAVNGYDVTYKDDTYGNFVKSTTIKDATPIVIVGANDGMVHAFKVAKIKDVDNHTEASADGYQTARFSDYPPTIDSSPPTDCSNGKDCIGKELWAYIPYNAVPYLRWYCDSSYCHIPMVDARFTVVDASIDTNHDGNVNSSDSGYTDTRTMASWRRLLIGGMGVGGRSITVSSNTWSSSIFVLDITNPANPKLVWERPLPDRTLTTSTPAIVRLSSKSAGGSGQNDNENGKWYLVFGSGPESVTTNRVNYKTGNANIYAFDLRTGNVEATLSTGASGVAVGDLMSADLDSDYQVDDVYFGTYGVSGTSHVGEFYRLRIRNDSSYLSPASWAIEPVIDYASITPRPIFASAEVAEDSQKNIWLYFGTGLYLTLEHARPRYCSNAETTSCKCDNAAEEADADRTTCTSSADCSGGGTCKKYDEYIYGVKESKDCWQRPAASTCTPYSYFLDTTNIKLIDAKATELGCFCAGNEMSTVSCPSAGICGSCASGQDTIVTKTTGATLDGYSACNGQQDKPAIDCLETEINKSSGGACGSNACNGWKYTLTGKKIFSRPYVSGGLADFTAFQPTADSCSLGGNTHLISFNYTTGTPYYQPAILMSAGTSGSISSLTINASVNLGTGVPPLGESLVALPLSGDTYKVITQVSGGLPGTGIEKAEKIKTGYILWITK